MQFLITFSLGKRSPTMNYTALVALLLASSATAFAPATTNGRVETTLSAKKSAEPQKKKSLAGRIFDLDLFAPVADQNDYGARSKKKIVTGNITDKSYVPSGLTKAQYEKIRAEERAQRKPTTRQRWPRLVSLKTLLNGISREELILTKVGSRVSPEDTRWSRPSMIGVELSRMLVRGPRLSIR